MLPQAVSDLYRSQQRRALAAIVASRAEWAKLSRPADFGQAQVARLFALVSAAQVGAARDGAAMVPAALEQSGFPLAASGRVNVAALSGVASDGRDLGSLLWLVPGIAQESSGKVAEQMAAGRAWLDLVVHRQVSDAGRAASGIAIAATPGASWVRYVSPPCCQRCAVLAGRKYRHSHGFDRHLRCDCLMRPVADAEPPGGYASDINPAQIQDLTRAQRKALVDGADLNQIVNVKRKAMISPGTAPGGRLTPQGIYKAAGDDRNKAIAMLRQYGYLI